MRGTFSDCYLFTYAGSKVVLALVSRAAMFPKTFGRSKWLQLPGGRPRLTWEDGRVRNEVAGPFIPYKAVCGFSQCTAQCPTNPSSNSPGEGIQTTKQYSGNNNANQKSYRNSYPASI